MALITCSECGKQISDRASVCIHCGCPIEDTNKDNKLYKIILKEFIDQKKKSDAWANCGIKLRNSYNIPTKESFIITKTLPSTIITGIKLDNVEFVLNDFKRIGCVVEAVEDSDNTINPINDIIAQRTENANAPVVCPRCGSSAITTGARGVNWRLGLIGASKTVNRCGSCGYTWEPRK